MDKKPFNGCEKFKAGFLFKISAAIMLKKIVTASSRPGTRHRIGNTMLFAQPLECDLAGNSPGADTIRGDRSIWLLG
jgi:hypothetical protein